MMNYVLIFVLPTIGGLLLYGIISLVTRAPGSLLRSKFISLGDFGGKSYSEILSVVGRATSESVANDENGEVIVIRQWMATGYHISLVFNSDDVCIAKNHEFSV